MEEDKTPPLPAGRGGRGAMIMKALQSMARQPGQDSQGSVQAAPSVPPPIVVSLGAISMIARSGCTYPSDQAN